MTVQSGSRGLRAKLLGASSYLAAAAAAVLAVGTASAITIGNGYTPTDAIDTAGGVNGVGQMIIDNGGGSVGLCTGTLINPRTVIFAAHCVNSRAETAYGVGGRDLAFFFNVDNRSFGGSDPLVNWLFIDKASNASLNYFNVNQVYYHPDSLALGGLPENNFLQADVALASLDTPAANIPTWALLFSPLPVPDAIDPVSGTGYHVNITGYGRNGTGLTGSANAVDYRRRAAENMLGALTSLEVFEYWLFGGAPNGLPQNVYFIDFDSPEQSYPYEIDAFRDEALEREGGTAGGDSGGPLILDAANNAISTRDLVIGVLSGGYGRFFNGAPSNGYGSVSFYQPLYLYWDYIVANNPYRYVTALAGNGNWEDAAHWQVALDPNYMIIDGSGQAVNGVPDAPGAEVDGDEPTFGQICANFADVCLDNATWEEVEYSAAGSAGNNAGSAVIGDLLGNFAETAFLDGSAATLEPQAVYSPDPLPPASIANGLPGATNFVPNNIDPTAGGTVARYYDVTLGAAGTTTLSSVVTVDRLTIQNTAGLSVAAAGGLTSLIDVNQYGGTVHVAGSLTSVGDYSLVAGRLSGNGTITTPFLTNVMGAIAPGTTAGGNGTVGTLSVNGSVIMSSGSGYLVDLASAASADRLNVTGGLNLGGTFVVTSVGGFLPTYGQSWTVASATGGITGGFSSALTSFGGVLRPELDVVGNNLILSLIAASFMDVGSFESDEQVEIATALDLIRDIPGGFAGLSGLYASLDNTPADLLDETFEALTPLNRFGAVGATEGALGLITGGIVDRTDQLSAGGGHGFDVADASQLFVNQTLMASADPFDAMMMGVSAVTAAQDAAAETVASAQALKLKEGWGGFLDVSTLLDSSYKTTSFIGDSDLDATVGTLGFDYAFADQAFAGFALSYGNAKVEVGAPSQTAEVDSWGVTVYGGVDQGSSFLTGYLGYSSQSYDLVRIVPLILGDERLEASPDGDTWSAGAKLGFDLGSDTSTFTPYAAIDAKWIGIDGYTESGGTAAMSVASDNITLIDARLGLAYAGTFLTGDGVIRPKLGVAYVMDIQSSGSEFNAAFAGFSSVPLTFVGVERKGGWVEYEAGLEYEGADFGLALTYTGGDNGQLEYNQLSGRVSVAW